MWKILKKKKKKHDTCLKSLLLWSLRWRDCFSPGSQGLGNIRPCPNKQKTNKIPETNKDCSQVIGHKINKKINRLSISQQ
jgi:hypothetical protein